MCILAVASCINRRVPFALISNRDEFLHRPTAAASIRIAPGTGDRLVYCADEQAVTSEGSAPGTWLGVNLTRGTFATVTNSRFIGRQARELIADDAELPLLSRGWLVRDALMSATGRLSASSNAAWWLRQQTVRAASAPVLPSSSPVTTSDVLPAHAATTDDADEWRRVLGRRMNGFNLVSGSLRGGGGGVTGEGSSASRPHIYYTSNTAPGAPFELPLFHAGSETATTGCVSAVSNSYLDCAVEPRIAHLRHRLEQILSPAAGVGSITAGSSHPPQQQHQADHAALAEAIERNDPIAVADVLGAPLLDSLKIPTIPAADLLDVPRKYRRLAAVLEGGQSGPAPSPVGPGSDSDVGNDIVDFACPDAAREAALRVRVARALQQNVYTAPLLLPHGSPLAFKAFGTRTQIVVFVLTPPPLVDEGEGATCEAPQQDAGATVHFCTRNVTYDGATADGYDFRKGDPAPDAPVPRVTPWQHFSAPLALD